MTTQEHDKDFAALDQAVAKLPRDIRPGRDLWPEIANRLNEQQSITHLQGHWWHSRIASAASIAIAASALTFALTRPGVISEPDALPATPLVSTAAALDPGFLANRKRLGNQFEGRLAELSPEMQSVVRQNIVTIRGSLNEISMALASDPDNADLQDLLLSTYEQELQVMTEINRMPLASAQRIDL